MKSGFVGIRLALLTMTALVPVAAFAQSAEPPALLRGIPGISPAAPVAGLQAWTMDGGDFLWLLAPDGESLISGYVFDGTGQDISSAVTGFDAMNFAQFMDLNVQAPNPTQDQVSAAPAASHTEDAPRISQVAPAQDPVALASPLDMSQIDDTVLQSLSEDVRAEVLIRLVEALRPVKTEAEFRTTILSWRAYVKAVAAGGAIDAAFPLVTEEAADSEVTPQQSSIPLPEPALSTIGGANTPGVQDGVESAPEATPAQASPEATPEVTFLEDTRTNTMWFSMGSMTAPVVYAYIDPTCPYCAASMKALAPQIDAGSIQLRVILAPLLSQQAPDVIAGILMSSDPVAAYMSHELAIANQQPSPVTPRPFADLPAQLAQGISMNYDMVMTYEVPGVPFFVFDTAEGEQYFSGVPDAQSFAAATQDTFNGRN